MIQKVKIGNQPIFYLNSKQLHFILAKNFYTTDADLFESVVSGKPNESAISVDFGDNTNGLLYFDMSAAQQRYWGEIVESLKIRYANTTEKPTEKAVELNRDEVIKQIQLRLVKNTKKNSLLYALLKQSPLDSEGFTRETYYHELKLPDKLRAGLSGNGVAFRRTAERYFKVHIIKEKGKAVGYQFRGYNVENTATNREIKNTIRKVLNKFPCAHCGTPNTVHKRHQIDHKNGRYDNDAVLDVTRQQLSDFQPLCSNHNALKRTSCKRCKETGVRYDAQFMGYGVSVTEGTLEYDANIGCTGCYWYDPFDFKSKLQLTVYNG
jgi:hypothetical protein